ncbi:hypothetical protein BJY04DRAFT_200137 [Aspergillus karnatakaensis]|uniref:uncharacterized protein n=1 Tax=Aspergillus karnatakaensis TaxID=1810916 RepID=UPI003CCD7DF0
MPQSGRDEGWLRAWCTKLDVPADDFRPLLPLSSTYALSTQKHEEDQANLLLAQASEIRRTGESKTTSVTAKIKKDKWSYEDYCGVLTEIVNTSGSVGVAESVWNSFQLQKPKKARTGRFARRHQAADDETDDLLFGLLCSTLRYKQTDMFHFLCHSASADVVNRILPTALQMNSLRNTRILLEENADPNTCPEEFLTVVRSGDEDFVRLLLQSKTPIDLATLTSALPDAVQRGSGPIVQLLLAHGADANAHNGLAMEKAVRAKRTDLALSLLMCPNPPMPHTLAPIVAYVFFKMEMLEDKKYHLIELLLNGGAAGETVSLALGGAVRQRWTDILELFVDKGVSVNYYNGEGYRHAVHEVDLDSLRILGRGNLADDLATEIFGEIYKTKYGASISNDDWRALAQLLLDQGACGEVVDEALIERVKARDHASVDLLLREGASVDYNDACALDSALVAEDEEFIDSILQYQPSSQSINTVFRRVETISHSVQLLFTRKLLDAGANGPSVDRILKIAMSTPTGERDRDLIEVLVDGGADVSQGKGALLQLAVQTSDDEILRILLLGFPASDVLASCIPLAMGLTDGQRSKIIHMVLHAGARGDEVSQALVDSIDGTSSGFDLASLLLTTGEANTGFDNGKSFKKAIASSNIDFLELLAQYNHLDEADFCACLLLTIDLPQTDDTRLEKIRILLMSGQDLSGNTGTTVLRHVMEGLKCRGEETQGVLHMLLEAGADVNHNQGRILIDAIELDLFGCFKLFLSCHPSFESLELAFEKALVNAFRSAHLRYIQELLVIGVPQETMDAALLRTTEQGQNEDMVLLLLQHGASINYQEGACVRKAIAKHDLVLLVHLLQHDPTEVTLNSGFALAMTVPDMRVKYESYRLLMQAGSVSQRLLDEALVAAADGGWKLAVLCELLLENKASPNYATGAPVCRAIKAAGYKTDMIKLFLKYHVSEEAVAAALACAFEVLQSEIRLSTMELLLTAHKPQLTLDQLLLKTIHAPVCDRKLVQCLLTANASVFYQGGESILHTVMSNDIETLRLLEPHFHGHSGVSELFMTVWGNGKRANSHHEEAVLSVLVGAGASGEPISMALLESVKTVSNTPAGFAFIVNLLKGGADVNYSDGASLLEAATQGNARVVKELLAYGPRRTHMTRAFPLVFRSGADSQSLREIAVAFCSHSSAPDLTYEHPSYGPILFQILQTYPNERELIQYLIDKGCTVDPIVKATLPLSPTEEDVSLLCWAIAKEKSALKEDVIDILVAAGANVDHQTSLSKSTPLQLAILGSRGNSVATLLHFHADPSLESSNGISPLSLAASIGNSNIARQLIKAGAAPGDGALHEAARMVNVSVLQVLLIEGKQRDYPCSRFQGRTALAELCLTAATKPVSQLKAAISFLKSHGDYRRKSRGKSVLHFALDNPNAIVVTQAVLDVFMSEHINADFNIFEDSRFRYSPLAYVSRGLNQAPAPQRPALIDLLLEFSCKDRFWAAEGDQPEDLINPPEDIQRLLKTQRQRQARIQEEQEDHNRRLLQRRAETAEELAALKARHNLTLENTKEIASETAKIEHETASRNAGIASQRYDAELAYMRQVTDLANKRKDDSHYREIEHRRNMALLEKSERSESYEHKRNLALLEKSQRDESYNSERLRREEEASYIQRRERLLTSGYEDRAKIDRDRYAEQMRLFDAQKNIVEMSSRPRLAQQQQQQIGYEVDSLD